MKARYLYIFLCLLVYSANKCAAQATCPPPNIGFEEGTFNNWDCYTGSISIAGVLSLSYGQPLLNRQTIIKNTKGIPVDPYGLFPTTSPNGSKYSMRLGNSGTGAQAEQVSYTFTIGSAVNNYSLFFNYAVVLQNPGHPANQQPRFTAKVFNVTDGGYVNCASFDFVSGTGLPGFKRSKVDSTVYYKDWATANINLQGYAGKQIRIEFTTNDCTLGAHFGYAYLDLIQDCFTPITGNSYCTGQTTVTLNGPPGFNTYQWYNAQQQLVGSGQSLKISPPPPDNTAYSLLLTPLANLGCVAQLETVVKKIDAGFNFNVKDKVLICPYGSADLTADSITKGSSTDLTLSYYTDPDANNYLSQPQAVSEAGTYYIRAINPSGCTNTLPIAVVLTDSIITKTTDPKPVVYPAAIDLSATFNHVAGITYSYFKDKDATVPISQYVAKTATYYIKATNYLGCENTANVKVIIQPPAQAVVSAPNVFTPNGDGINDYFFVTINGFEDLKSLRVYNRYGKEVFDTKTADNKWDGTLNGQPVATGTYYWVYEGASSYNGAKTKQAGSLTLVR